MFCNCGSDMVKCILAKKIPCYICTRCGRLSRLKKDGGLQVIWMGRRYYEKRVI